MLAQPLVKPGASCCKVLIHREHLLFLSAVLADKHHVYEEERRRWTCPVSTSDTETLAKHSL